ncbi:glycosyltransferase family 4 protein [Thiohalobacter sp. IOR34]|uniref:glycosyltransferase family 4 protein n=1 Tax=Thiohalobacter sp. IOR34 TaxID=3057176 RepID=UPI0025B0C9DA|nr:glycosyltransferase family 4 protein [Thiohalobacter sp. IOR34]WJW74437.1 glycosyltransferase family 4 protein [Thiohalobacter sp. IOR34]
MKGTAARTVLYVENGIGYGGAAICMRHLVRNLDPERYRPLVVTGRSGPDYASIASEAEWHHIRDRHLDVVGWRRRLRDAGRLDGPLLGLLLRQALARLDDLGNFLPFFLRLLRLARQRRVDLIHANNEPLCNRAALLTGRLLGIPVVCHVRGDQSGSRMMHRLYRLPDHFIPVSHWISDSVGRLGVPADKRTVIYDGIDLQALEARAEPGRFRREQGLPEQAFTVGLVGLLIPWKGQRLFLDAAHRLAEQIPGLRLLLVGGTPDECRDYEAELRERVRAEGLEQVVHFTGHLTDMPSAYLGLDVVVSASTSPEPLGTVVIESMALGRPLVAPNHGGAAEMAEHERSALLFRPGDSSDLATQILRLYRDPDLGRRLGAAAREHAFATFDVARHAAQVQALYDRVLAAT